MTGAPRSSVLHGFHVREGAKGNFIIELDCFADPAKDAAWLEKKRAQYPSEVHFRREYLRDRSSAAGEPFYPEFALDPKRYIRSCVGLIDAPIIRGWDFGIRGAACVWMQYSAATDRLFIIRELLLKGAPSHSFRDLVLYLSGEVELEELRRRNRVSALQTILALEQDPDPRLRPPWFERYPPPAFIDYAGHEASQRNPKVELEGAARTEGDILAEAGILLGCYYRTPKARAIIMRRLLQTRPDGFPGLFIDPTCRLLIRGFSGGIRFKDSTKGNPDPDEPHKDGTYEHLHDAAGYGAVNTVPATEPEVAYPDERDQSPGADYRTPPWRLPAGDSQIEIREILHPNFP